MRIHVLALLGATACIGTASIGVPGLDGDDDVSDTDVTDPNDTDDGSDDTDDTDVDPGDTDTDGGGGDDTDDTDVDPSAGLPPSPARWAGERQVTFLARFGPDCEVTATERGAEVTGSDLAALQQVCPACDRIFVAEVTTEGWCFTPFAEDIVRGLELVSPTETVVWSLTQGQGGWSAEELAEGDRDGNEISYFYEFPSSTWEGIEFDGFVSILPPRP